MTELMKRYEAETDEIATWSWHNKEFVTDDVLEWASEKIQALDVENAQLKAQLTWRPVSEKPENDDWVTLRRNVNGKTDDEQVWFYHLMDVKEWEGLVKTLGATHWLPIPPAPEAK